jgi:hypothetical protein
VVVPWDVFGFSLLGPLLGVLPPGSIFLGTFSTICLGSPSHCRSTINVVGMGYGGGRTHPSIHIWIRIEKTFPTVYGSVGYGGGLGIPTSLKSGNYNGKVV